MAHLSEGDVTVMCGEEIMPEAGFGRGEFMLDRSERERRRQSRRYE